VIEEHHFAKAVRKRQNTLIKLIHDQAALMLVTGTYVKVYAILVRVILLCAGMIDLGTSLSGWELICTLKMIIDSSGSL
jgi:hypothetical protein